MLIITCSFLNTRILTCTKVSYPRLKHHKTFKCESFHTQQWMQNKDINIKESTQIWFRCESTICHSTNFIFYQLFSKNYMKSIKFCSGRMLALPIHQCQLINLDLYAREFISDIFNDFVVLHIFHLNLFWDLILSMFCSNENV